MLFLRDEVSVVRIALRYLYQQDQFRAPALADLTLSEQIYLCIRLYFIAGRLQLPRLQKIAYEMLCKRQHGIMAEEIVDMAAIIYEKPTERAPRIRDFLQHHVQLNLRPLMNLPAWRELLRTMRQSLAADMFDLVATVLLEGEAGQYPPKLPPAVVHSPPELDTNQTMSAYVIQNFTAPFPNNQTVKRGDRLINCRVLGDDVTGDDHNGVRHYLPRDYVHLSTDTDDQAPLHRLLHQGHRLGPATLVSRGGRRKLSRVLGIDYTSDPWEFEQARSPFTRKGLDLEYSRRPQRWEPYHTIAEHQQYPRTAEPQRSWKVPESQQPRKATDHKQSRKTSDSPSENTTTVGRPHSRRFSFRRTLRKTRALLSAFR